MPRTKKRPSQQVKKKGISKRQETSLDKHGDKHGAKHKAVYETPHIDGRFYASCTQKS
jgi:hypothetical protein